MLYFYYRDAKLLCRLYCCHERNMQHPHWQRHRYTNTINLNLGNTGGKSHNFVFHHFVILIISILPDVIDTSAYNIEWTSCYNAWAR